MADRVGIEGRAAGVETAARQKKEISNDSASREKNKSTSRKQQQPRGGFKKDFGSASGPAFASPIDAVTTRLSRSNDNPDIVYKSALDHDILQTRSNS